MSSPGDASETGRAARWWRAIRDTCERDAHEGHGQDAYWLQEEAAEEGKVRMKDLRGGSADDKEVDLPLDGLIAALAEMGITSSGSQVASEGCQRSL